MMISSLSDLHMSLHEAPYVLPVLSVHTVVHRQLHRRQGFTAARPRCTVSQVLSAAASSLQPVQTSILIESKNPHNQGDVSPSQLRSLWDGVGKPLLRVGKGGVQASHVRSLRELLQSHPVIKVQINQHDEDQVNTSGQQLASQTNARLLQVKGRTALFAEGRADLASLRQHQKASQQHLERVWHNADGVEVPIQLQPDVQAQLHFLNNAGVLSNDELDRKCLRVLSQMPQGPALTLLKGMNKSSMRTVRNKSAWLNSQCRRIIAQART